MIPTTDQTRVSSGRLLTQVQAVCPGALISVSANGAVSLTFKPENTAPQRTAAQSVVDNFDWSQAAQDAWDDTQQPDVAALRSQAVTAVQNNNAYVVTADTASNIDVRAQVKALTQQNTQLIKSLGAVILRLTGR